MAMANQKNIPVCNCKFCSTNFNFCDKETFGDNTQFSSFVTHTNYNVDIPNTHNLPPCKLDNVVYLITCSECGIQYVGLTKNCLGVRACNHRSQSLKENSQQLVHKHFHKGCDSAGGGSQDSGNSKSKRLGRREKDDGMGGHGLEKRVSGCRSGFDERAKFTVIDRISDPSHYSNPDKELRDREIYWMEEMQTVYPLGLNVQRMKNVNERQKIRKEQKMRRGGLGRVTQSEIPSSTLSIEDNFNKMSIKDRSAPSEKGPSEEIREKMKRVTREKEVTSEELSDRESYLLQEMLTVCPLPQKIKKEQKMRRGGRGRVTQSELPSSMLSLEDNFNRMSIKDKSMSMKDREPLKMKRVIREKEVTPEEFFPDDELQDIYPLPLPVATEKRDSSYIGGLMLEEDASADTRKSSWWTKLF